MSEACLLTPTKHFCVTCERLMRKVCTLHSINPQEAHEHMFRLCQHATVHGCEARIRPNTLDFYNRVTHYGSGPIIEIDDFGNVMEVTEDECSAET